MSRPVDRPVDRRPRWLALALVPICGCLFTGEEEPAADPERRRLDVVDDRGPFDPAEAVEDEDEERFVDAEERESAPESRAGGARRAALDADDAEGARNPPPPPPAEEDPPFLTALDLGLDLVLVLVVAAALALLWGILRRLGRGALLVGAGALAALVAALLLL